MKKTLTLGIAAVAVASASSFIAAPAFANDITVNTAAGYGSWDDSNDNLCANDSRVDGYDVRAKIVPQSGSRSTFQIKDVGVNDGRTCTGNLSIPEDQSYVLQVIRTDTLAVLASQQFYT